MKITRVEPIFIAVPYEHGGPKQMRRLGPWTLMETLFEVKPTDPVGDTPLVMVAVQATDAP